MKGNSSPVFSNYWSCYLLVCTSKKIDLDTYFTNSMDTNQRIGLVIVAGSVCVVEEVVPSGRELIQEEIQC